MRFSKTLGVALAAGLMACSASAQTASQPPEADRSDALTSPALKGPEVIAFIGLKPGDKVADIVAGRFVRAFSQAVGPKGVVYAVQPDEMVKRHPMLITLIQGMAAANPNVKLVTGPINAPNLPPGLDAVFIRQDYHDLHDAFMGPADVGAFNRAVFAALKPGGVYVVLDHAAAKGSGLSATETLHRIDPAAAKAEIEAAGFKFNGASPAFVNPADPHDKNVFDPSIRGHTDQFMYRFRKPA